MNCDLNLVIPVFKKKTCDAEACKLINSSQKGGWLVFKVEEATTCKNR